MQAPAVAFVCCCTQMSFVAAPSVMLNSLLSACVRPLAFSRSVYPVPALSRDTTVNVATPLEAVSFSVP
jgi:hypothetical protein